MNLSSSMIIFCVPVARSDPLLSRSLEPKEFFFVKHIFHFAPKLHLQFNQVSFSS